MKKLLSTLVILLLLFFGCKSKFGVVEDLSNESFTLVNQKNETVKFPDLFKGKVAVVGYIFTNCPDICPLTTNNLRLIQKEINEQKIKNIEFVAISFDPEVDTPEVLKEYAELRNIDESNFTFLTGEKETIETLMKRIGIFAIPNDTTMINEKEIIFYVHTDRISLFDEQGKIRKNYPGSTINIEEITNDIIDLAE
ncbi:MAG: SCO family protein [Melioribacteraceae bacterium]|nr:SCO family protein [Melioribacteraceae bacterium]MDD3559263.1 SCO family protein [Melioribacteraceae bacterium]